jgi:2-methylisocitrate lyase-like PEP mutase family enzyme
VVALKERAPTRRTGARAFASFIFVRLPDHRRPPVRALPFPFTLTARAENFLFNRPDLVDTIRRLRAFEEAGADVLYAPGLPDLDAIRAVCAAVSKPVNVIAGLAGRRYSVAEFADAGVKRISLGSTLARAALGALARAALEIRDHGRFDFVDGAMTFAEANALMRSCLQADKD